MSPRVLKASTWQRRVRRTCGTVAITTGVGVACMAADPTVDYSKEIQPVLARRCVECHGPSKAKSGLRLDMRSSAFNVPDGGAAAIVPGQSAKSEMVARITSSDPNLMMPPTGERLTAGEVSLVRRWIDGGAAWPDTVATNQPTTAPSDQAAAERIITARERAYWAFQPVQKPATPKTGQPVATPIDAFIVANLEEQGLVPAPPASRLELIRRVAYDLTGLPPVPEEINVYLSDNSPTAYEQMVDRYLDSPRYGEQWGRHWLDVVRFGESEGFEYDTPIAGLWRYRDYVIASFNADKPYNQFVREQIAGDEMDPRNQEYLVAAGFHRLGPVRRNKGNQEVASSRNEVLTERTDIIGAAFLGLTIGCARCHDHKFDPILQKDYYRLQAFMAGTDAYDISTASPAKLSQWKASADAIKDQIAQLNQKLETARDEDKIDLRIEIKKLEGSIPLQPDAIASIKNYSPPTPINVLKRGEWDKKGDAVGLRFPSVLVSDDLPELPLSTPNPRTLLAKWLTDPANPLTPRVMANRIWQYHFGTGLVKSSNNFGIKGETPTNPRLLDYLTDTFIQGGWRLKPLHRLIMLSSTYRQSWTSPQSAIAASKDPDNRWLWHFDRRRLTAEELRDSMLAACGQLNGKAGGESVFLPVDPELVSQLYKPEQWVVTRDPRELFRRSVYTVAKRNLALPFMEVFDQPSPGNSCSRRESSTHAPQALELLNGATSNQLAAAFAERLRKEAGNDTAAQVDLAFRLAAGRPATHQEKQLGLEFLKTQDLSEFALAMFNLNAFLYVN